MMKTILLCNLAQADRFISDSGLSSREVIRPAYSTTLMGARFTEADLILEWPGWREAYPGAQEIVDALKIAIARGNNAGPEWVSSDVLTVT